jgi:hypothetical protein
MELSHIFLAVLFLISKVSNCCIPKALYNWVESAFQFHVLWWASSSDPLQASKKYKSTSYFGKNWTKTEFVYLFWCTLNVNNNIQSRRFVVSKYSWKHSMSRSLILSRDFPSPIPTPKIQLIYSKKYMYNRALKNKSFPTKYIYAKCS